MRAGVASGLLCLAALAAGCGYEMVRYRGALGDARSVSIVGARNETREPGLDSLVTDALLREFQNRGALQVVESEDGADLVLRPAVKLLSSRESSLSSIQFVIEYEITLGIAVDVRRRDGSEVPIDRRGLVETEIYLVSADVEAGRKNRKEALRRLSSLLASRVHDALFERLAP